MIFDKIAYMDEFDVAIYGLGYESRSTSAFKKFHEQSRKNIVIGYETNRTAVKYNENKIYFQENNVLLYENDCESIIKTVREIVIESVKEIHEPKIFLDITVMSRHRMAYIIYNLLSDLSKNAKLTICYNLSYYVEPPCGIQPVKKLGPIIDELSGDLGSLSMPTSIVFGLGYEEHKALGVYNYYDSDFSYAFIPKNPYSDFEIKVRENNKPLLNSISEKNIFTYDVTNPYSTYVDLKSLVMSLSDVSRTILVPLGPKIFAALAVILGKELYPKLPIWRVSSLHSEEPVERASHKEVLFSVTL
ncbi:hypothetical protein EW121_06765 [Vibrio cholerae]|uniref:hypothetical protein n=1 Tax=Vibrio cholerae TaxID=666 RepID=UPI000F0AFD2F|nr:hypothetical protein [Vibrio cholerae]EGR0777310.1 hypothetical protein [Vibrio cholerae]EGR0781529.1 hypothetical protein [Vibrio cholerae]EGR0824319.1 hypothetical protein [Vibrio cholerae]EGR0830771.1 hypothetical protein [Vibrio cholerae]EGR0882286.1 hypothetical protein [Vibrio cholerae]